MIGGALALAIAGAPAYAQDASTAGGRFDQAQTPSEPTPVEAAPEQQDANEVEAVVVTGSRIARPNLEAPTAVTVVDQRVIEATGQLNAGDILRTLPQTGVSALTTTNSNFFTQNNGIVTVDLRNLGEDRTLVLVNGRRYVAGVPGSQTVDFNTIPTEFIERIDVVTGGASAVYGSDALAGVINIITQRNFQGFDLTAQAGITERGDDERYRIGLRMGTNFADDRGNAALAIVYTSNGEIFARDRCDQGMCEDALSGAFFGEDFRSQRFGQLSATPPQGTALIPRVSATGVVQSNVPYTILPGTTTPIPFVAGTAGFNRQAFRGLQVPVETIRVNQQTNYTFNENLRFFSEFSYFLSKSQNFIEPTPLGSNQVFFDSFGIGQAPSCRDFDLDGDVECRFGIPITSGVVPEALRQQIRTLTPGLDDDERVVGFNRRLTEAGLRSNQAERQLARLVFGLEGQVNDTTRWELSMNYGRTTATQRSGGAVLIDRVRAATDVITDPASGQLVCRDTTERARGCVPVFLFQQGGISQAGVNYISVTNQFDSFVEQWVINGFVNGQVPWELPAGAISYVVGGEFRREESRNTPDPTIQQGLISGNAAGATQGQFNVYELYGELQVPLLRDLPFARRLDLNLAGRFSDYSIAQVNTTAAYAASLEWEPIEWLRARAQYSRAVRAPNISELFGGFGQTFPTGLVDPCRGVTTTAGGQPAFFNTRFNAANPGAVLSSGIDASTIGNAVATACLQDPAVAARVARDGGFSLTQPESQGISGFNLSNPNLSEEVGTSRTLGLVFTPRFNRWYSNVTVSIDYFDIDIDQAIGGFGRALSLSRCYQGPTFTPTSQFCSSIVRYQPGTGNVGAIRLSNLQQFNIAAIKTSGVDLQVSYRLDLNEVPWLSSRGGDWGQLTLNLQHQYLESYDSESFAGAGVVNSVGSSGAARNEGVFNALWVRGPLQLSWQTTYQGEQCAPQFGSLTDGDCNEDDQGLTGYIGIRTFSDAQIRYDVNDMVRLTFGVNNVFDEYVFLGQGLTASTGWTTEPSVYDPYGRRYYASVRLRF